jgi:APA family basic amino acid/polyamine antiporter
LERRLGLFDAAMIMIGIVIGSGIFLTSGIMARDLPSAPLLLAAWIFGGLLTLTGALTYAELGAALPHAGGQYVYLREAYGPAAGFLYGWVLFLVYMTGGIAALALAFSEYLGYFVPSCGPETVLLTARLPVVNATYTLSSGQISAAAVIFGLSLIHYFGVRFGQKLQNLLTLAKLAALAALVVLGFALGRGNAVDWAWDPTGAGAGRLLAGFGVSLIAVAWAFDGWNNVNFVTGEIRSPSRNLPRALILGTLLITVLYAAANLVYLHALPLSEMSGEVRIAEKAASALFGPGAATLISALVLVSVFGAVNGSILAGPRVYYAMAKDGLFFRSAAVIHPRFKSPGASIAIQAVWAAALALAGTFQQIFTFTMFISIAFWIAAAAAVFRLRKIRPDLPRPYRTWGYPVVPALFILTAAGILFNTFLESPVEALAGVVLTAAGIPVYLVWNRRGRKESSHE